MTAAVIGAGPAGLMAAERLATAGVHVDIYDRMPSVARKFLMAGRGGLNLTHGEDLDRLLARYGPEAAQIRDLVSAYSPAAVQRWAEGLGQELFVGTSGRIFPKAMKASPLLRAWLMRLGELKVAFHLRHHWTGWDANGALAFRTAAGDAAMARPDITVLALGGASWPRLGSDGSWTDVLARAGVAVAPLQASNAGVRIAWSDVFRQRFEGAPIKRAAMTCAGHTEVGEAVVTRDGLEGGAVYALNRIIRTELARGGAARVLVDVRPSFSHEELARKLSLPRRKQSTATFLRKAAGMAPIATALVREGAGGALPTDPSALADLIKAVPLLITGMAAIDRAISSAGGVRFEAVEDNLMLRGLPGVFVAGEMLDWDAPTGGYLLQATFATAVRAADGALAWLGEATAA